ncbi:metal-dependent transcriptional regulator [Propionicimonas sp.]|uniref:metal-dependent transcriptional regulator n=1 Tax=Propionicimonas sp. TaxID=1955623 RepID=UPI0017F6AC49|nr:metal-dependent transcriptional regulator [Propionicimonas sp.]MBU3975389.1 metal-dependent transcriptional regulator [Actinomycetota bacterium]MBA3020205.1 metal-dependent transcriptional regulator [Propionicimonas sp.]MBU3986462.1 metal-dependent transcriptional regulator [Actinomycetota bacterium]MBU4008031.1 metal-dependent transcriptional regulator [Actinomycetota bacterium]MBU4064289.1 metal-dependent transcriptional regulator [Actinomycetota bacterium]
MEVGDLSKVAQDYLKVIWSASEWGEPPITTKGLAERFSTTRANVSETLHRLDDQGLLIYRPYRPAVLTPVGRRLAIAMVRRHRLLEAYLAGALGYSWSEVHDEAERLEHAVSELFLTRVDELLGQPRIDPHGDPIPDGDGNWPELADTAELASLPPGSYVVARVSDADAGQLAQLAEVGVRPGAEVKITPEAVVATGADQEVGLTAAQLDAVRVFLPPAD